MSVKDTHSNDEYPYSTVFDKNFPYYLAIGMTYDQYWNDDSTLVIAYREADRIRFERRNQEAWIQGRYIYDAISRLAPILRSFGKKNTKADPYVSEPYPLGKISEEEQAMKDQKQQVKARQHFEMMMTKINKRFGNKE